MRCSRCASRPKRAAKHIEKVLRSAISNAERRRKFRLAARRGPALRQQVFRERRRALEAFAPRAHGPRIPLPEAHRAHLVGVSEHHVAAAERVAANIAEAEAQKGVRRHCAPRSQGFDREAVSREEGKEVMGQKNAPVRVRLGYNKPWKSRWYADRDYAELLHEDVKLRRD